MTTRNQGKKLLRPGAPMKSFAYHGVKLWNSVPMLKFCDKKCEAKSVIRKNVDKLVAVL